MKPPSLLGELLAEFFGTMILILFGVGVVAQVVTQQDNDFGDHNAIALGWFLGVTLGVYVAARLSGAHLNPAVSLALAVFRGFSWAKVLPYSIAQFLGAFVAALLVRWNYSEAIAAIDPGHTIKTQGIFSTLPGNGALPITTWEAFRDQVIGTAILLFVIFAVTDLKNTSPGSNLAPVIIGLLVLGLGIAWGSVAGYAINPARDFGPRVAELFTGYSTAMRDQNGQLYFWVPILGPLVGGVIGGGLYKYGVERFLPLTEEVPPEDSLEPHTEENARA